MAVKYQAFPGMDDILPGRDVKWQWLEARVHAFFGALGYGEIRTPIVEPTELFIRSIGEASDIVHKEMYTFQDRGGRSMTMRPELTASVARAVIEHGLLKQAPSLRLYYLGPMFRAERPQAGRKRQFHQAGVEIINEDGPSADLESIKSLYEFLLFAGVRQPQIRLNDLSGIRMSRQGEGKDFQSILKEYFLARRQSLCKDCHYRLEKNVLRIFDCKVPSCQEIIEKAPWDEAVPLSGEFQALRQKLEDNGIPYEINRRLVRGLDYYTGTVFEVIAPGLGAQDAIAGGGRYDGLYRELGMKKAVPCTGWSLGVERLLIHLEQDSTLFEQELRDNFVYLAPVIPPGFPADGILDKVYQTALKLRRFGVHAVMGRSAAKLSDHLKKANKLRAKYVIIAGDEELQEKKWTVKHMDEKVQSKVNEGQLLQYLKGKEMP